jgi:hypothetical protein
MVRSKERKPASTWATGTNSFTQTRAAATVEFTSPYTTTRSGMRSITTGSKRAMIWLVCCAWEPEPASKLTSGAGNPSCWQKMSDMLKS